MAKPGETEGLGIDDCADCGLRLTNPRLSEEHNNSLYGEAYFRGQGDEPSVDYSALDADERSRAGENEGIFEKIATLRPGKTTRVLDAGCGTGSLLTYLVRSGMTSVMGVELSAYAADFAHQRSGAPVINGDLHHRSVDGHQFDVINATEVVEHLRDPMTFFARVRELLAPGGVFIYSTGNVRSLYSRALGRKWPYMLPDGHLFFYSPETLQRYFRKVGLGILSRRTLTPSQQLTLVRAEAKIAHSQMTYVGLTDSSPKGRIFRAVARIPVSLVGPAVAMAVGRYSLPIGIRA